MVVRCVDLDFSIPKTVFKEAKTRTRINGHIAEEHNIYGLENLSVEGYEIHMGMTENLGEAIP